MPDDGRADELYMARTNGEAALRPGDLLLTALDASERARGVVCDGEPATEPFALALLPRPTAADRVRSDETPRPFVTERTALLLPDRDHAPAQPPASLRNLNGAIWHGVREAHRYRKRGVVLRASDVGRLEGRVDDLADHLPEDVLG